MKWFKIIAFLTICILSSAFGETQKNRNPYSPYRGYWGDPREFKEAAFFAGGGATGWGLLHMMGRIERKIMNEKFPLAWWERALRTPFVGGTLLGTYLLGKYYTSNWDNIKNYYIYEYNRKYKK